MEGRFLYFEKFPPDLVAHTRAPKNRLGEAPELQAPQTVDKTCSWTPP